MRKMKSELLLGNYYEVGRNIMKSLQRVGEKKRKLQKQEFLIVL
jgi:hypothetical protein